MKQTRRILSLFLAVLMLGSLSALASGEASTEAAEGAESAAPVYAESSKELEAASAEEPGEAPAEPVEPVEPAEGTEDAEDGGVEPQGPEAGLPAAEAYPALDGISGGYHPENTRILFDLINDYRKENGLPALEYDADMYNIAHVRVAELTRSYSTTRPDGSKFNTVTSNGRATNAEKIAYGKGEEYLQASKIMETLKKNPGHLLSDQVVCVGIDCYYDEDTDKVYWALEFSKTLPDSAANNEIPVDAAHFPDAVFRELVSSKVDKDGSGTLSQEERDWVKRLTDGGNMHDLRGIEYFRNLETINAANSQLTSIDVSKNTALKSLDVTGNSLRSLDVSKNTKLESLFCGNNQLTSLTLGSNSFLCRLECDANSSLRSIDVSGCPLITAAVKSGVQTTRSDGSGRIWYTPAASGETVQESFIDANNRTVYYKARLVSDPGVSVNTSSSKPVIGIASDGRSAVISGDPAGLYARVALIVDNGGRSGLYVTQATINADGSIAIPNLTIPGLTVKAVNISLVRSLAEIQSSTPNTEAIAFKYL